MGWTEDVVGELCRCKRAGVRRFDVAWSYAMAAFPAAEMAAGPRQRELLIPGLTDEMPLEDFLRERCRMEWEGMVRLDFAAVFVTASVAGAQKRGGHAMAA